MVNYYYSNEEQLQQIQMAVIEDQVIDHILESATIETVEATYESVVAGTALPSPDSAIDSEQDDSAANEQDKDQ